MTIYKGTKAPKGCKQYCPSKPVKHGFKNWALCGVTGYTYRISFYEGRSAPIIRARSSDVNIDVLQETGNKCSDIVLQMTGDLPNGSFVLFDNLFATFQLIDILAQRDIGIVSTFRKNRLREVGEKLTEAKTFMKQERGSSEFWYNRGRNMIVVHWLDTKPVILCSNFVGIQPVSKARRWNRKKELYEDIDMPAIVKCYNKFMGGVDLSDMLISLHASPFRWKKWYLRLFARLLDQCIVNAWLVYREHCGESYMALYSFRSSIAEHLLHGHHPSSVGSIRTLRGVDAEVQCSTVTKEVKRKYVQPQEVPSATRTSGNAHMPEYQENCQRCRFGKCQTRTYWRCSTCRVHLCLQKGRNCFLAFHK